MLVMWILTRISVGKSYLIVTTLITNSGGERVIELVDEGSLILRLASS